VNISQTAVEDKGITKVHRTVQKADRLGRRSGFEEKVLG
jgi:hypothetical protein